MPYAWQPDETDGTRRMLIWRHRSLTPEGFAWVMGSTAAALTLPLLAVVGSAVMWGLLPFALAALAGLWFAVQRDWKSGGPVEEVALTPALMSVIRRDPGRADRHWQGNPYWVRLSLRRDGPVENYLTLSDGRREIELGAFLSPEERRELRADLSAALTAVAGGPPRS